MTQPLYERDPEAWEAYLAEGNAKQARKRVAVDALIRDANGRVLLVRPNYKPGWDLPGGMAEANEAPMDALAREVREELSAPPLASPTLLCVDWVPPHGPWDDQLAFIFDLGIVKPEEVRISTKDHELAAIEFSQPSGMEELLRPRLLRRVRAALASLTANSGPIYLQNGDKVGD